MNRADGPPLRDRVCWSHWLKSTWARFRGNDNGSCNLCTSVGAPVGRDSPAVRLATYQTLVGFLLGQVSGVGVRVFAKLSV